MIKKFVFPCVRERVFKTTRAIFEAFYDSPVFLHGNQRFRAISVRRKTAIDFRHGNVHRALHTEFRIVQRYVVGKALRNRAFFNRFYAIERRSLFFVFPTAIIQIIDTRVRRRERVPAVAAHDIAIIVVNNELHIFLRKFPLDKVGCRCRRRNIFLPHDRVRSYACGNSRLAIHKRLVEGIVPKGIHQQLAFTVGFYFVEHNVNGVFAKSRQVMGKKFAVVIGFREIPYKTVRAVIPHHVYLHRLRIEQKLCRFPVCKSRIRAFLVVRRRIPVRAARPRIFKVVDARAFAVDRNVHVTIRTASRYRNGKLITRRLVLEYQGIFHQVGLISYANRF